MVNVLLLFGIIFGIALVGAAIGFFIWKKTRPKKISWEALVYMRSDAVHQDLKDEHGNPVPDREYAGLELYARDKLVKEVAEKGRTVFKLVGLERTVPNVTMELIKKFSRYYGPKVGNVVEVLYEGDSATLLKSVYDVRTGRKVWRPMPYDRSNAFWNDYAVRRDRIASKKDILQAILPYVAIIVALMSLIGITYLAVDGMVKITKEQREMMKEMSQKQVEIANLYRSAVQNDDGRLGMQLPGGGEGG